MERIKRIAVILPVGYRGGTLRGAKLIAKALWEGSRQHGEDAEIVFAHLDDPVFYPASEFNDLPSTIPRRCFTWKTLDHASAQRAMIYAGHPNWKPTEKNYIVPDDQIRQFFDCDLWVIISDRLYQTLLPIRPYILMIYDYLQRYLPELNIHDKTYIKAARNAERVMVTTNFTKHDALQYAGIDPKKIIKVPMLTPEFAPSNEVKLLENKNYFLWTTNATMHKNHINALQALRVYYEELDGHLECHITGVDTLPFFEKNHKLINQIGNELFERMIRVCGELPTSEYKFKLARATFLWHAAQIDNGTFCVVEAAHLNVPSLSSDYPAMQEMNTQYSLGLTWMKADDPIHMAQQLKWMEINYKKQRDQLPSKSELALQNVVNLASQYWETVRACL